MHTTLLSLEAAELVVREQIAGAVAGQAKF